MVITVQLSYKMKYLLLNPSSIFSTLIPSLTDTFSEQGTYFV
jgi:hypothetical protein